MTKQSEMIKIAMLRYLEQGVTNKREIFTKVVDELGVPRPTVRRCSRELIVELIEKAKVLGSKLDSGNKY